MLGSRAAGERDRHQHLTKDKITSGTTNPIETLLARQEGWRCLKVTQEGRTVLRHFSSLKDVSYAFGQIACLLAAHRKLVYGGTDWYSICGELPRNITAEELCYAATQPDSRIVTGALHAVWHGNWPRGIDETVLPKGYSAAYQFMDRAGYALFMTAENLQFDLTTAAARSIKVQVGRALRDFDSKWAPCNQAIFQNVLDLLGHAQLWFMQDIEL